MTGLIPRSDSRSAGRTAPVKLTPFRPSATPEIPTFVLGITEVVAIAGLMVVSLAFRSHPILEPFWRSFGFWDFTGFMTWRRSYTALLLFQVVALPVAMYAFNLYRVNPEKSPLRVWAESAAIVAGVQGAFTSLVYVLSASTIPHHILIVNTGILLAALPTVRAWRTYRARDQLRQGVGLRNVLIVGTDQTVQEVAAEIVGDHTHGRRVVGFLSDALEFELPHIPVRIRERPDVWTPTLNANEPLVAIASGQGATAARAFAAASALRTVVVENVRRQPRHLLAPVGTTSSTDVNLALDGLCVEEVFVSGATPSSTVAEVIRACRDRGVDVHLIPQHYPEFGARPAPWALGSHTVMGLYSPPIPRHAHVAKRALDIVGGVVGLILFAPALLIAMLAIKIESPGAPAIYKGARLGMKGRHFPMMKLRTMVPDAEKKLAELRAKNQREGPWFKLDRDPRILRVGALLRKLSIDEAPQFWNVIKGDMSLVGPRPLPVEEAAAFVDYDLRYYRRLDVKPGMTGPWQISARNDPSFETCMALDLDYIHNWSLWRDIKLLVKTPFAIVLRQRGSG